METFSRSQQLLVLLIIFGIALLYFHSINQPEQVGRAIPANYRWAEPTLQAQHERNETFALSQSRGEQSIQKLSGAQLLTLNRKINLNTASVSDLEAIPGIGLKTAEKIVDYRKKHGRFKKIEDTMNVPGIKGKRFEKIKKFLTVN